MPKLASIDASVVAGKRVLVVDDDPTHRYVVRHRIGAMGGTVVEAADGHEALARLDEHEVDLIVMDLHMPGMDGREATRRIRERGGRYADLPIIAISGAATPADEAALRGEGATAVYRKPMRTGRFALAMIEALIKDREDDSVA